MSNAKIMMVLDDDTDAAGVEERLQELGYAVCANLSCGRQAIEKAPTLNPDLALIDLGLNGEVNAIEVAERIDDRIPVIYLTDDDADLLARAEETRPFGYVVKPIDERQLRLSIRTALSLNERESERAAAMSDLERRVEELQRGAQVMEALLDSMDAGVVAIDDTGKYLAFNSPAKSIFGAPQEGVSLDDRSRAWGFFYPDRVTPYPDDELPLRRALSGESHSDVEIFVRNADVPDGAFVSISARPVRGLGEGTRSSVVTCRDVTRRKEAEINARQVINELRHEKRFNEAALDQLDDGIVFSDGTNRILYMNRAARRLFGTEIYTFDTVIAERSKRFGIFLPDRKTLARAEHLPLVRAVSGEETESEFFVRNELHPDGLRISIHGCPIGKQYGDGLVGGSAMAVVKVLGDGEEVKSASSVIERTPEVRAEGADPGDGVEEAEGSGQTTAGLELTVSGLRNRAEFIEVVFDNMDDGIAVADVAGRLIFANEATKRIFGDWISSPKPGKWSETFGVYYPDVKTFFPDEELPLLRAVRGEETEEVELFVCNEKNPKGTYVSARARPIFNADRTEIIAALGFLRDISGEKKSEATLRRTATELRDQTRLMETVFGTLGDGVVVVDEEGKILLANPSIKRIFGMDVVQTEPRNWSEAYGIYHLDRETLVAPNRLPLALALKGEIGSEAEFYIRNANNLEGKYIMASARPIVDAENGKVLGSVGIVRDVTKRKLAEIRLDATMEELRNQNELMEATFNSISDGIVVADEKGQFLHINPAAEQISGIRPEDTPPEEWSEEFGTFYPDRETPMAPEDLPLLRAIFKGESTDDMDVFLRNPARPDGVYIRVSARPLLNEIGGIRGGVIAFRDVTELMLSEEALARAFAQGRLEIVDTILHNIGNAINSVTTGIETVRQGIVNDRLLDRLCALANAVEAHSDDWPGYFGRDPQGRRAMPFLIALARDFVQRKEGLEQTVDRVRNRANHIADIVRTQRALGSPHVDRKDVNLRQSLASSIRVLQDSLGKRKIEIDLNCDGAPAEIRIQESQFHQMMVNLIKNGLEAIDELKASGGLVEPPRIGIRAYVEKEFLHVDVTDNGIGIDVDKVNPKVFFSAGYTTKESGSGLGLHSAANFVIGSGGQIHPMSEGPGKGTTMRVMLRLTSVVPSQEGKADPSTQEAT